MRVVVSEAGGTPEVVPDPRGRAPGRGAHLHPSPDCLTLALRRKALPRALRVQGGLGTAQLEAHVHQVTAGTPPATTDRDERQESEQQLMSPR